MEHEYFLVVAPSRREVRAVLPLIVINLLHKYTQCTVIASPVKQLLMEFIVSLSKKCQLMPLQCYKIYCPPNFQILAISRNLVHSEVLKCLSIHHVYLYSSPKCTF